MEEHDHTDWWLWQLYRQVATYVNEPTLANEARLRSLIGEYRRFRCRRATVATGE